MKVFRAKFTTDDGKWHIPGNKRRRTSWRYSLCGIHLYDPTECQETDDDKLSSSEVCVLCKERHGGVEEDRNLWDYLTT